MSVSIMNRGVFQTALLVSVIGATVLTIVSLFLEVDTVIYDPPISPAEIEGLATEELERLIDSRQKDIGYIHYLIYALETEGMRTLLGVRFLALWVSLLISLGVFHALVNRGGT